MAHGPGHATTAAPVSPDPTYHWPAYPGIAPPPPPITTEGRSWADTARAYAERADAHADRARRLEDELAATQAENDRLRATPRPAPPVTVAPARTAPPRRNLLGLIGLIAVILFAVILTIACIAGNWVGRTIEALATPPAGVPVGDTIPDGSYKLTPADYHRACVHIHGAGSTAAPDPDSNTVLSYQLKCSDGARPDTTGGDMGLMEFCRDVIGNGYIDAGNPLRFSPDAAQTPWYQWYCVRTRIS